MLPQSHVKRCSFRFYLNRKRDAQIWECLQHLEEIGYTSLQAFANDAFLSYYDWVKAGRVPYRREELKASFQEWMQEVLIETQNKVVKEVAEAADPPVGEEPKRQESPIEIEQENLDRAFDFLSTL